MNRITALLLFISPSIANASELELKTVFLPLYVQHAVVNEGAEAVHTKPREVSFISRGAEPETTLHFLKSAYIPSHDTTWHEAKQVTDTNLISLCAIQISHSARKLDEGGHKLEITVDTSLFALPDTVSLSKEMTIDLVRRAITLNFPHAEIIVKDGEQAVTGQPATRPEPKSEGSDKPQPESEGRPQ